MFSSTEDDVLAEMAAQPLFERGVGKVVFGREELFTAKAQDDGVGSWGDSDQRAGSFIRLQLCGHLRDLSVGHRIQFK